MATVEDAQARSDSTSATGRRSADCKRSISPYGFLDSPEKIDSDGQLGLSEEFGLQGLMRYKQSGDQSETPFEVAVLGPVGIVNFVAGYRTTPVTSTSKTSVASGGMASPAPSLP